MPNLNQIRPILHTPNNKAQRQYKHQRRWRQLHLLWKEALRMYFHCLPYLIKYKSDRIGNKFQHSNCLTKCLVSWGYKQYSNMTWAPNRNRNRGGWTLSMLTILICWTWCILFKTFLVQQTFTKSKADFWQHPSRSRSWALRQCILSLPWS